MRKWHQEAFQKSVMLGHSLQASWVMPDKHDKPCILPDPGIFALDRKNLTLLKTGEMGLGLGGAVGAQVLATSIDAEWLFREEGTV